jgi:hypothetical protein
LLIGARPLNTIGPLLGHKPSTSETPRPVLDRPAALRRFVASKLEANAIAAGAGFEHLDTRIIDGAG